VTDSSTACLSVADIAGCATWAAAFERNFSTFGFIHSKMRNSLGPEKVKKRVISRPIMQRLLMLSGRASQMMIRIRIPPFRLIQLEFLHVERRNFPSNKASNCFYDFIMVLAWFYIVF
jgi:hypothetical protein